VRQLTQTNLDPGNCLQTALACVLDVPAEDLPDQVTIESGPQASYLNFLNAYLEKHHLLMLSSVYDWSFKGLKPVGHHLCIGTTERHPKRQHAVVGFEGAPVWDPHPSRAGLKDVREWLILAPMLRRIMDDRLHRRARGAISLPPCECPRCATGQRSVRS
jgi:hypothetical protein